MLFSELQKITVKKVTFAGLRGLIAILLGSVSDEQKANDISDQSTDATVAEIKAEKQLQCGSTLVFKGHPTATVM